ncbi:ParB/RepB/Spo0J family partition protein [Streptomyces prunicolor]|jgi:ParB-like chromosome segregation protein Spo0J|uniref:ParB/RepB/Spo0J family partition protein n=1 Tax=Streptomyces prunicolor TaxID=67348 RepID=UPI00343B6B1D
MNDGTDFPSGCTGNAPQENVATLDRDLYLPSTESYPAVSIGIKDLVLEGSPRSAGEDPNHTRILADVTEDLPPIIVHGPTRQVIDGMHRVRAAVLNGRDVIRARLIDCDERTAFVLAVKANVTHGLPLTPADRKVAADSIIASHPEWSDRTVAASTGLSDKTVAAIRTSATAELPQSNERLGRDGRVRPLNSASRRRHAAAILMDRPDAGLREVARATGLSPATVRDVRKRTDRGEDPVPERYRATERPEPGAKESPLPEVRPIRRIGGPPVPADVTVDRQALMAKLMNDPSVRFSEAGKYTLRWLYQYSVDQESCQSLSDNVPQHWAELVADLARSCAMAWVTLAEQLEERSAEGAL